MSAKGLLHEWIAEHEPSLEREVSKESDETMAVAVDGMIYNRLAEKQEQRPIAAKKTSKLLKRLSSIGFSMEDLDAVMQAQIVGREP